LLRRRAQPSHLTVGTASRERSAAYCSRARTQETSLMRPSFKPSRALIDNLIWFAASLVLAFIVWVIATLQSDPIQQQRFSRLEVRMNAPPGLIITTPSTNNRLASVIVNAPRSVLDLLTSEEIAVSADLSNLGAGDHTVDLQVTLARQPAS